MSYGQTDTRAWLFSGIVYDNNFNPLPYTHVIAKGTGKGDITDRLSGLELDTFMVYLNEKMSSTYKSAELDIIMEIHALWENYSEIQED